MHQLMKIWTKNMWSEKKDVVSYMLERLTKITGSQNPVHNMLLLANGVSKYIKLHYTLFGHYSGELMQQPSKETLRETSGIFSDFLKRNELEILIPMMEFSHSMMGYGYIDEIGTLYGLMWNTPKVILSIVLKTFFDMNGDTYDVYVLKKGFQHLWKMVVEKHDLNIQLNSSILRVNRNNRSVEIQYKMVVNGSKVNEKCDFLIWTPPMSNFAKIVSDPSDEEKKLFKGLTPHVFVSTLTNQTGTIRNRPNVEFAENVENKIDGGVLSDVDIEGVLTVCDKRCPLTNYQYNNMVNSSRIVYSAQVYKSKISVSESNKMLTDHYHKSFNASKLDILKTIPWNYFYKWSPSELSKGNHWKVFNMQGLHRTWYAGASVSFESVKSVIEYNTLLLKQSKI